MIFQTDFVVNDVKRLCDDRKDARHRAWGDNLKYDGRVAPERAAAWEGEINEIAGDQGLQTIPQAFAEWFKETKRDLSSGTAAPAFAADNHLARQSVPAGTVRFVRVEDLSTWLDKFKITEARFLEAFAIAKGSVAADDEVKQQSVALIADLVRQWNDARDNRPAFGAFHDGIAKEVADDAWHHALRDRLGLGHYGLRRPDGSRRAPFLVGLMEVPIVDIIKALPPAECDFAFAAPTILDGSGLSEYFFPTPGPNYAGEVSYGRVVDLQGRADRLVNEILHRPIAYKPEHLVKVARIEVDMPDLPLWEIRNRHLRLLRSEVGDGFAAEMTADD
ncbi:MAG TPA: hypothetical protein VLL76_12360 [Candidatus Omnitrophota bacterium]|nr:hypothetical protein [Candidatus Omnitrophota bacterium]